MTISDKEEEWLHTAKERLNKVFSDEIMINGTVLQEAGGLLKLIESIEDNKSKIRLRALEMAVGVVSSREAVSVAEDFYRFLRR